MTLTARQIVFHYRPGGVQVLAGVDLELSPGAVVGLFGPNGSGKSTLLRCLNASLKPHTGEILLKGQPLSGMSRQAIARHIAVVPQDTPADVPLRVREVVMLGRYAHWGTWNDESDEDHTIVDQCLKRLGVIDLADRCFSQLSGGERQRVVIARALAQQGEVLLLDEPNAHLDLPHQLAVYRLARELADEGQAVLMICHDLLIAPLMVDRAVVLNRGLVAAAGPAGEVLGGEILRRVFQTSAIIAWQAGGVTAKFESC